MLRSARSLKGNRMDVKERFFKRLHVSIFVAIVASILLQSLFLWIIKDNPNNFFNGNFVPLWTHDAGLYGFYAKELLSGVNLPFETEYMAGWLLYALTKMLPFSIDNVLFFAPVVLSSLIIIPIVFIAKLFHLERVGFFGGILATLAYGYYYRSFFGYYDTDILNLFFPLIAIWGLIGLSKTNNRFFALLSACGILGFNLWYHSFEAIALGIISMWTLYTLLFERDKLVNYLAILMMGLAFLHVSIWLQLIGVLIIFTFSFIDVKINEKYLLFGFLASLGASLFFINPNSLYTRALDYINKGTYIQSDSNLTFLNTLNTVSEAQKISLETWGFLTASNTPLAFLGAFGFVLICLKHKQFLLFLPLVLLGLLSMVAGERFVMFGVVAFSLGLVYLVSEFTDSLAKYTNIVFLGLLAIIISFYIQRIIHLANVESPVFNKIDLKVLSSLPKDKNNFILSWWDYGWPLWYTTGARTLIDNGKHFEDSYIISKLLFTQNQTFVANVSKNSVRFFQEANQKGHPKLVPYIFQKYKPQEALNHLNTPSQSIRPIYWYLHTSLLRVGNTIKKFSDIDPASGQIAENELLIYSEKNNNVYFDKKSGVLHKDDQKFRIHFYTHTSTKELTSTSNISDLYLIETPTHYLISTPNIFRSFLVQALLFQRVDTELFEIVSKNDTSMLLRVK